MNSIQTERLTLRPLEPGDAAQLWPIWADEEVVKNTYIPLAHSEEDCRESIEWLVKAALSRKDLGPFAIYKQERLIGIVGAARDSSFEFGLYYHLGREFWGQGYATESAKVLVAAAFAFPEIVRVSADALTTNPASSRVLEKIGMKFEGCLRMKFYREGTYGDLHTYSLLRKEYSAFETSSVCLER